MVKKVCHYCNNLCSIYYYGNLIQVGLSSINGSVNFFFCDDCRNKLIEETYKLPEDWDEQKWQDENPLTVSSTPSESVL